MCCNFFILRGWKSLEAEERAGRRVGKGVLLEPMPADAEAWFAELDRLKTDDTFLAARRKQPKPPRRKLF